MVNFPCRSTSTKYQPHPKWHWQVYLVHPPMAAMSMDVQVHALSGVLLCAVQVQGSQTVADLKGLIHESAQIKPAVQKLLLGRSVLRNTDCLSELFTQGIGGWVTAVFWFGRNKTNRQISRGFRSCG